MARSMREHCETVARPLRERCEIVAGARLDQGDVAGHGSMGERVEGEESKSDMGEAAVRDVPRSGANTGSGSGAPAGSESAVDAEHRRMRWASRRGMLELDLILEPFVREAYGNLSAEDRERYRELMLSQDQELFAWFLKREVPDDPELAVIVRKILSHARERPRR